MTEEKDFARRFHFYFNLVMMVIYTLVGVLLIFILRFESLPSLNTKMIGGVLLLYGIYRGYRLYKENASRKQEDQKHADW
jgi:hypothetical protein